MKTHRSLLAAGLAAVTLGFISCAATKPDLTYKPAPPQPKRLGTVAFANATEGFVLVSMDYGFTAEPGTPLYAMNGQAGTAKLVVTQEKQKQFVVANIEKGRAVVGQPVVFFPEPDKAPKL